MKSSDSVAEDSVAENAAPVIFSSSRVEPSPSAVVPSSSLAENTSYLHYYGPGVIPTQTASTALFLPERITSPSTYSSIMPPSTHSYTEPNPPRAEPVQLASGFVIADASIPPTPSIVPPEGSASLTASVGRPGSESDGIKEGVSISSKDSKTSKSGQDTLPSSTDSSFYGEPISRSSQTASPTNSHASDQAMLLAEEYWNDITDGMTIEQIFGDDD